MIDITKIRVYMLLKGLNLTLLSIKLNKPKSTLHRWFERKDMPVSYAGKLIEILDIPRNELLDVFFKSL